MSEHTPANTFCLGLPVTEEKLLIRKMYCATCQIRHGGQLIPLEWLAYRLPHFGCGPTQNHGYEPEGNAGAHGHKQAAEPAVGDSMPCSEGRAKLQWGNHAPEPRREDVHKSPHFFCEHGGTNNRGHGQKHQQCQGRGGKEGVFFLAAFFLLPLIVYEQTHPRVISRRICAILCAPATISDVQIYVVVQLACSVRRGVTHGSSAVRFAEVTWRCEK